MGRGIENAHVLNSLRDWKWKQQQKDPILWRMWPWSSETAPSSCTTLMLSCVGDTSQVSSVGESKDEMVCLIKNSATVRAM